MARLPRLVLADHPHVILHRGNGAQPVFIGAGDCQLYLAALRESARAARVAVHGYGLLPNEIRLLVTPQSSDALATMMQSIGRHFVPAFNKRFRRSGSPWNGRFRSTVIEAEPHFASCLRFVECFDVKSTPAVDDRSHGVIASSAAHHLGERLDPLVTEHAAFWAFGNTPFEREAGYRRYLDQPASEAAVAAILLATMNGWALGSPAFCATVTTETGRRARPAAKGRPRKHQTATPML